MSPLRMNLPQIGIGEQMDPVLPKDLIVSRRIHHLNSKLKYMGVLDIKEVEDLKDVKAGLSHGTCFSFLFLIHLIFVEVIIICLPCKRKCNFDR
jgi:hypothetical protein